MESGGDKSCAGGNSDVALVASSVSDLKHRRGKGMFINELVFLPKKLVTMATITRIMPIMLKQLTTMDTMAIVLILPPSAAGYGIS